MDERGGDNADDDLKALFILSTFSQQDPLHALLGTFEERAAHRMHRMHNGLKGSALSIFPALKSLRLIPQSFPGAAALRPIILPSSIRYLHVDKILAREFDGVEDLLWDMVNNPPYLARTITHLELDTIPTPDLTILGGFSAVTHLALTGIFGNQAGDDVASTLR